MASTNSTLNITKEMIHKQDEFMLSSNRSIGLEDGPNLGYKNRCDMPILLQVSLNIYFDVSIVSIIMDIRNVFLTLGLPPYIWWLKMDLVATQLVMDIFLLPQVFYLQSYGN